MKFIFDPSLVLYVPLCGLDGASFASRDAYGHLCTVSGALWRPCGHYFDGTDDRIVVSDHTSLSPGTSDFSLEAWVRAATDCGAQARLISKQGAAWFFFKLAGGKPYLSIKDGTNDQNIIGTTDLRDANWYHIVVTVVKGSTTGLIIFVNGEIDKTDDASGVGSITNTTDLQIARFSGGTEYFKGDIGEVRMYLRALSPLEMQHNYLATKWRYR